MQPWRRLWLKSGEDGCDRSDGLRASISSKRGGLRQLLDYAYHDCASSTGSGTSSSTTATAPSAPPRPSARPGPVLVPGCLVPERRRHRRPREPLSPQVAVGRAPPAGTRASGRSLRGVGPLVLPPVHLPHRLAGLERRQLDRPHPPRRAHVEGYRVGQDNLRHPVPDERLPAGPPRNPPAPEADRPAGSLRRARSLTGRPVDPPAGGHRLTGRAARRTRRRRS
jgi:hypothetical protein